MIKSRFSLKQLEAFVQVVDTGTFRGAAAALGTTQPNISARVSALETSLEVTLLYRNAGSVRLTEEGLRLLDAARDVILAGEALLETAGRHALITDRLRLGVTELIACTWLHRFLRAFRTIYPAVKVELQVDLSREIDRNLAIGQLDLALQTAPFSRDFGTNHVLGHQAYVWTATPEVAQEIGTAPDMARLFDHVILTHARHTQAASELAAFADQQGFSKDQIVHSSSLATCLPMAIDGMGIAMLPYQIVAKAVTEGQLVALSCPWTPQPLDVVARYDDKRAARYVVSAANMAKEAAEDYEKQSQ